MTDLTRKLIAKTYKTLSWPAERVEKAEVYDSEGKIKPDYYVYDDSLMNGSDAIEYLKIDLSEQSKSELELQIKLGNMIYLRKINNKLNFIVTCIVTIIILFIMYLLASGILNIIKSLIY